MATFVSILLVRSLLERKPKFGVKTMLLPRDLPVVVEHNNSKRGSYTLTCKRHHPKTKDWRKTAEQGKKRPNIKVSGCDCKYRLKFKRYDSEQYMPEETTKIHNHAIDLDPFQFDEHKDKDPTRGNSHDIAGTLRDAEKYRSQEQSQKDSLSLTA